MTFSLGNHWSFNLRNDPKRLAFVLSRYQFAADIHRSGSVLELGCSEGIGAPILAKYASHYTGVDLDHSAIDTALTNFPTDKYRFIYDDFMGKRYGLFESVVSLDVIEHIYPEHEEKYLLTLKDNLHVKGSVIIGTPNITAKNYASEMSNLGHVNLYSQKRLVASLQRHFIHVLAFGMNDELIHTGFDSMCHYLFCIAFQKRETQ